MGKQPLSLASADDVIHPAVTMRGQLRKGAIYFAKDTASGLVKIGFTSRHTRKRSCELQVGCPGELEVLAEAGGTELDESALHRLFDGCWVRGEWFRPNEDLTDLIEALADGSVSLSSYLAGIK